MAEIGTEMRRPACKSGGPGYQFATHTTAVRIARRRAFVPLEGNQPMSTSSPAADARSAHSPAAVPGVRDVRAAMGDDARAKSTAKALALLAISLAPYVLGFAGFFVLDGWVLKTL